MAEHTANANGKDAAVDAGLTYVSDTDPGIRRQRRGKNFVYFDSRGRQVTDDATLDRIRQLAIPPAYVDVWICAKPRGHLQATGRDARGRKQYRYHTKWRSQRDSDKYGKLISFGERLPHLRRVLRRDLALPKFPERKILAIVVSLLAETQIRVGNVEYVESNGSYGLTTLRSKHLKFLQPGRALFRFRGKSGQMQEANVTNARLVRLLRRCQQLPGQTLFQYLDEENARHPIDSGNVNDYLHEAIGDAFTAKDFRTWSGTAIAVAILAATPLPDPARESARVASIAATVKQVAEHLRNTPAVCRKSYIHPAVFAAWRNGYLHRVTVAEIGRQPRKLEIATLKILRSELRRERRAQRAKSH